MGRNPIIGPVDMTQAQQLWNADTKVFLDPLGFQINRSNNFSNVYEYLKRLHLLWIVFDFLKYGYMS